MKKYFGILTLVLVGLASVYSVNSQTEQTQYEDFSNLSFNIETDKNAYVLSEPIPLIMGVKNETGRSIKGNIDLDFSSLMVKVIVQNPDKTTSKFRSSYIISDGLSDGDETIASNRLYQKKQLIEYRLDEFFPTAGEYQIRLELCDNSCVFSNSVSVTITKPQGEDLEAYGELKKIPGIMDSKPQLYKQSLESFVSRYSKTIYGNYSLYNLANLYLALKEYQKAKDCLEKISYNFAFIEEVNKNLKEIERKLRERSERKN